LFAVGLAEQTDEWTEQRRYMGPELLAKARKESIDDTPTETAAKAQPELSTAA
jgi:putative transposase